MNALDCNASNAFDLTMETRRRRRGKGKKKGGRK
jgi:hypothetical protein